MRRVLLVAMLAATGLVTQAPAQAAGGVPGVDVSNWTGDIDWAKVVEGGGKFAFVHATEGSDWISPRFQAQYGGAAEAGLFRGAYHFALPHSSSGAQQAEHFVANGGAWTSDGLTLPGVLDLEDNPYQQKTGKNSCYDLSQKDMVAWIKDFTTTYRRKTGRDAIIYTTTSWWRTCTGDSDAFGRHPLWLARWGSEPGELPKSWTGHAFWQSTDKGPLVGGGNVFNGTEAQLKALANPPAEVSVSGAAKGRKLYTITVANTGPHPVTNVKVDGRAFGGKVVKAPGCKFSGTAVRCVIPELARGKKVRLTVTLKPRSSSGAVGIRVTVGTVKLTLKGA
ncbi:GH25 family lysozyme [Thermoactinospora rubra]|uniref:GH25 family lysozyme n=1 Tax=Thermoactinospora rubra TaxID=1088767 RepID=UPI001301EB92|nr:GH25 family lysozyme [Thermoactinospora rubra]